MKHALRWIEFTVLFVGLPLAISMAQSRWVMFVVLWTAAAITFFILKKQIGFQYRQEWNAAAVRYDIKRILMQFILLGVPILLIITYLLDPSLLFSMPRTRPLLWAAVMVLYPLLSVWPQEFIFRTWIYHRYGDLWQGPVGYICLSALAFGFVHVIFHNWIAVVLAAIGGAAFAYSYLKRRSLALCSLEHALYGCAIFTIGLGHYFFNGNHVN